MPRSPRDPADVSRRKFIASASALCLGGALAAEETPNATSRSEIPPEDYRIARGRIRQSVMGWCYDSLSTDALITACHRMGMPAMEGIASEFYPKLRARGMKVAIVGSHDWKKGPLHRMNHAECLAKIREGIDLAVEYGSRNVITFTGLSVKGVSDKQAVRNCLECWKQVIGYAEEKKVNLCLEHINSRDTTHPMKGNADYFGDDVEFCVDLIRKVGSPRMKLLFDIYHVQIMNGDVIRRIRQYKDLIAHVHTAGVPGRNEIDDTQEINYPPIMKVLLDVGYTGYVAQEFMPTWKDPLAALRHGVRVCDV